MTGAGSRNRFSAIYRRPDGKIRADWIIYDTLGAAMLGPSFNRYVGERVGYLARVYCGPPALVGLPGSVFVDLAR